MSGSRPRMAGAAAMLSLATLLSRILGLVREQIFAALLGAGFYGDAFTMAFRLPNLLRDLFAEGALSAAFQPAFLVEEKQHGREAAFRLASLVMALLVLVVGGLTLLGVVLAPQLVATWAAGYQAVPGKAELTVLLTRVMMPFLLLVSLAAVAMGMLNAQQRFVAPALAPALFNLAAVLGGGGLWFFGIGRTRTAAIGWAVATLCGGLLQLGVQLVPLRRDGFRLSLRLTRADLQSPGLRQIVWAMAPATIGLMATQVNIYVSSSFASTEDGAVTWLQVAFRLMQLPIGMFGVAVGTVALAQAAERASETDLKLALDGVRDTLRRGLLLVSFYTLPTAAALWVLAEPVLRLIYQHGAFQARDTLAATEALRYYALGLWAYAAIKVVAPVFYAVRRVRIPVIATVIAVLVGVLWNLSLHPHYGYRALALGTSVTAVVNLVVLLLCFSRYYGGLWRAEVVLGLCRVAVAAVVSGLVMWATLSALLGKSATAAGTTATSPAWALVLVAVAGTAGGGSYVGLCWLMGVKEVKEAGEALRRRARRITSRRESPPSS
ncbi:MAG: murein biosynthesis integral membrane protein MurJ [Polyangia bacterium]